MPIAEDSLSHLLAAYKSDRAVSARFSLSQPWALASTGVEGMLVRMCSGSAYWIQLEGEGPVQIAAGDIVALPFGTPHVIASAPHLESMPLRTLIEANMVGRHGDHPLVFSHGGGGARTELYSLHVWMPTVGLGALLQALPRLLVMRSTEVAATSALALALAALVDETISQRPGWQLSVARLADLLLVHILRQHLGAQAQAEPGILAGMNDARLSRALARMHAQPAKPWSVASLAAACGMSRTVFSEQFRTRIGLTPMQYLTAYRMTIAAEKLKNSRLSVAEIAEISGYDSEKAFARAFRRQTGMTPAAYVRQLMLQR